MTEGEKVLGWDAFCCRIIFDPVTWVTPSGRVRCAKVPCSCLKTKFEKIQKRTHCPEEKVVKLVEGQQMLHHRIIARAR